jgi:hypothetical protein
MALKRITIQPDDTEGHIPFKREDLSGQEVTVRVEDGSEVQGHAFLARHEHTKGDYTERLGGRSNIIELEVGDSEADVLRAVTDKGEPLYVRFPDGAEVKGHAFKR